MDEKVRARVNTPVGTTEEFTLKKAVLQGTVFAPLKSSIQFETLSEDCWSSDNGELLYVNKKSVSIPPLQMIDDILTVSTCGLQAITMNATLNAKIEGKKLRMSHDKSHCLHISKRKSECNTNLKVHKKTKNRAESVVSLGDRFSSRGALCETV